MVGNIEETLYRIVSEISGKDLSSLDKRCNLYDDMNFDSIKIVELIVELEIAFDLSFDDVDLNMGNFETIDSIKEFLLANFNCNETISND